jgi:biofilm PGA synthesis N-glycosyltransferase PgaC
LSGGPSVSALIPAFNEEKSIARTILSVKKQTYPLAEVFVIDDCSTDATAEVARACGVTVLRTDRNRGAKAQAQAYALQFVKTDLFITVDADTVLDANALALTIPSFTNPSVSCACGMVIPQRIDTVWERARFIEYLYGYEIVKSAQSAIRRVLVAPGCFTVFRTSLVADLGGFDNRTMAEDMDLTWTLLERGYVIAVVQEAYCFPIEPASFKVYVRQLDRWYRGFLQNIKVRRFNLFRKDVTFGILVYYYVIAALLAPLTAPFLLWVMFRHSSDAMWLVPLSAVGVNAVLTWIPALFKAHDLGMTRTAVNCLPATLVVPFLNWIIYVRSIWREWVRGTKLSEWRKGH